MVFFWALTSPYVGYNREIYITGTAPYSTGTGYSTSTVRLQSWYVLTVQLFFVDLLRMFFENLNNRVLIIQFFFIKNTKKCQMLPPFSGFPPFI